MQYQFVKRLSSLITTPFSESRITISPKIQNWIISNLNMFFFWSNLFWNTFWYFVLQQDRVTRILWRQQPLYINAIIVINKLYVSFTLFYFHCIPWDITPPISVTKPEIIGKYGDQAMSTDFTIKMSPVRKQRASSMCSSTHARFLTRPGNTQQPLNRVELSADSCTWNYN